jgi:hypothetical protein
MAHPTLSRHLGRTAPGAAEQSIPGQRSCPSPPCQRAAIAATATLVARVRSLRGRGRAQRYSIASAQGTGRSGQRDLARPPPIGRTGTAVTVPGQFRT